MYTKLCRAHHDQFFLAHAFLKEKASEVPEALYVTYSCCSLHVSTIVPLLARWVYLYAP